MYEDWEVMTK